VIYNQVVEKQSGDVAQLVRAPACHAGGLGFESRCSPRAFTYNRSSGTGTSANEAAIRRVPNWEARSPSLKRAGWRAAPASCACATDRTMPLRCCRGTQLIATRRSPTQPRSNTNWYGSPGVGAIRKSNVSKRQGKERPSILARALSTASGETSTPSTAICYPDRAAHCQTLSGSNPSAWSGNAHVDRL